MNPAQVTYLLQEAFRTMRRHRGVSVVSIAIMSLSLLILAIFLLVTDNMLALMERTRNDMRVYVYLTDGLDNDQVGAIYNTILLMEPVEEVVFISKDEALGEFRERLGEEGGLLEALEANPLPASFRVALKSEYRDLESVEQVASSLSSLTGVEEVNYGREFIERFSSVTRAFLYIDAVIGLIVILSSIFIIANTVHLAVVSRKDIIDILKLVGATNRFITTPFFIEGAFQGGVAALISLLALWVIYAAGRSVMPELAFFTAEKALLFIGICLAMGALGSLAALRRFLRITTS